MTAQLEVTGNLSRKLRLSLSPETIQSQATERLKKLSRTVKMHGFRPGKVPLTVVTQQYGDQIRHEVTAESLEHAFRNAVMEHKLKVAGLPQFDVVHEGCGDAAHDHAHHDHTHTEFVADFEVFPEIELPMLNQGTVQRPVFTLEETHIDRTLQLMRNQKVTFEQISRPAQKDDRITFDYRATINGEPFPGGQAENHHHVIGSGGLLADFENALTGMQAGEEKTFPLQFPEDYHATEIAGKTASFSVQLKLVEAPVLPEINADFAKAFGIASGDIGALREEVRQNLTREIHERLKIRTKNAVTDLLVQNSTFDIPQTLIEKEGERLATQIMQQFRERGVGDSQKPLPANLFREQAERNVRLGLIAAHIIDLHKLNATPEQIKAQVQNLSSSYEKPEEVIRWHYQNTDALKQVESTVTEENLVQWVLANSNVADTPIEFEELMEIR